MTYRRIYDVFFNKEVQLTELLKLKKVLETKYLNHEFKIRDFKFKIKFFFVTKSFYNFSKYKTLEYINIIEKLLNEGFSKYKLKGDNFNIKGIDEVNLVLDSAVINKLLYYNLVLGKYNSQLIIQGSYADRTNISYSDIDLVIIGYLSKEVLEIKKKIESILLQVDPLQHHGVFFINKNSFSNYWQMDLPIETLKKSKVFSNKPLKIEIPSVFIENKSSKSWLRAFLSRYKNLPITINSGAFYSKYFISQLLLVPTLVLASKGVYVYKRDSFVIAKSYYSDDAWSCINIVSLIRKKWNQNNISFEYSENRFNLNSKDIEEFNSLLDVVDIEETLIIKLEDHYKLFINETENLIYN